MDIIEKNKQLIQKIETITQENLEKIKNGGDIHKDEELQKHITKDKILEQSTSSGLKPIPINLLFRSIYDPDTNCQLSKEKLNFKRYILYLHKDYDIQETKSNYKFNSFPNLYKMSLKEIVDYFNGKISPELFIKNLDDFNSYPKIMSYKYIYQHPLEKPVFMGPKVLGVNDEFKIILISPICFLVEMINNNFGFTLMDTFYTLTRYKFEMKLEEDLSISRTKINAYFGVNFTKTNWFKEKITSSAFEETEELTNNFYIPLILKEINLINNKFSLIKNNGNIRKNSNSSNDEIITNDSFIGEINISFKNYLKQLLVFEKIKKCIFDFVFVLVITILLYILHIKISSYLPIFIILSLIIYMEFRIIEKME